MDTKKICKICDVLQIFVYLFKRDCLCQQVYRSLAITSPNLYRVQKFSSSFYVFRHHLETNVDESNELKEITWKRIQTIKYLDGIVKVRLNHLGAIVAVGEY